MKQSYRIIRTIIVSLLFLAVGIPIFLYLMLWLTPVHEKIRTTAASELSALLGADVSIGGLKILPFTRVALSDIAVSMQGDTVLTVGALNAGISGRNLLTRGRIVITGVELMNPDIRLGRDSASSPLNIAPIIERLKGNGSPSKPAEFSLAVHTVVVRGGKGSYNVESAPAKTDGSFDPNHISVSDFNADLTAPRISNNDIRISLKRLSAREQSGLYLRRIAADVALADSTLEINGLGISLDISNLRFADMKLNLRSHDIGQISLLSGSAIYPCDLAPLYAPLASVTTPVKIDSRAILTRDSLTLSSLHITIPDRKFNLSGNGFASALSASANSVGFETRGDFLAETAELFTPLKSNVRDLLAALGDIAFTGSASWSKPADMKLTGTLTTDAGTVSIDSYVSGSRLHGSLEASAITPGRLLADYGQGSANLSAAFDLGKSKGSAAVSIESVEWRGNTFENISASLNYDGKNYATQLTVDDQQVNVTAEARIDLTPGNVKGDINADISGFSPADVGILEKYEGFMLSGSVKGAFSGPELYKPKGELTVSGLKFINAEGRGLIEKPIHLETDLASDSSRICLTSDLIDATASGRINLKTLGATFNNLLADALPQYFDPQPVDTINVNDFTLEATVHDNAPLLDFLNLPIRMLYQGSVSAAVCEPAGTARLLISVPYLQKGSSLISHTTLTASTGSETALSAHTSMPTKFGDMDIDFNAALADNRGTAALAFSNHDELLYGGEFALTFKPLREGADINIKPGVLTLGNVDWSIEPAFIGLRGSSAIVNGFSIARPGQELSISGTASKLPDDRLKITLDNINLDYIFQTLQMAETVQFGGDATGTVTASALFSSEPILQTDNLFAKNFSYGHCIMGDARVQSRWNNETRGIEIHADVENRATEGLTVVNGVIFPLSSELDFHFQAHHTPVGFLRTFMSTWASNVGGTASGSCHLYGNFKLVDMTGDFLAENFALTIGFTGVTYTATDSVHIRPGIIRLNDIVLSDPSGHTARLNGALTHNQFQDASFNFTVTDLDRILVLDTRPLNDEDRWYGTIRANGTVSIDGVPGRVSVNATANTAAGSEFNFALSNAAVANEYTFLTFRDATPLQLSDPDAVKPGTPELDRIMKERVAKAAELASTSNFNFDLQVDVTPEARMNLIMDPDAGDKISGSGSGHLGIVYNSANDEMRLYGTYTIARGDYNFSLQDIILKNFSIKSGSTVKFDGDPMDAKLNISAVYQVNANLSDLDESFLTDKEVQRTNVPVYALLNIDGSIRDSRVMFDLDLPTLSSDVKRKVKSIISTEEMMSRQIIYLLALNRFYTPEYMSATKGNDLMSVASGTLSSQLSNILGRLSNKISVAPSVRTESGDFSDVEFDVALSSNLLNDRLLLNGNFGYRDKALNNNQFIGDFDVEYLLSRQGNWRLKAYNHFNDRNLYVKTALTTQGLGLVFKHDFDTLFRRKRK